MAGEKAKRQAMNLSELDEDNDKFIKNNKDFVTKIKLQDACLKTTFVEKTEKPEGPALWATSKPPASASNPNKKCHMQVTVVLIKATIPNGNTDGTDKSDLPVETFLPRNLAGEWSIENMFYSNSNPDKPNKGIYIACPTNVYDYADYWMHVPSNIRNAVPTFTQKYVVKHSAKYKDLKTEHITVSFYSFKCNLAIDDSDDATEHVEDVHGVKGGPTRLKPFQEIAVNENLQLEIKKLGDIENFGEAKKLEMLRGLYINCQSRAVISKTNDKSEAFLNEARSQEFMRELTKACPEIFFGRVEKYIREKVKKDVTEAFTCKWTVIEEAILSAVGREHNITKIDKFIDKDGTDFHGYPLDILFSHIDAYVDQVFGTNNTAFQDDKFRTISLFAFTTNWKYILITRLVRSLPSTFSSIKEHIRQEVADILTDITKLVEISTFAENLKTFFRTNGHLQQFTTVVVAPPNKKSLSANNAGVEDKSKGVDPAKKKEFDEKFKKWQVDHKVEASFKKGMIDNLSKLCNETNKTSEIGSLPEFKEFCKKSKHSACYNCISINCLSRQRVSQSLKMKRIFNNKCSKKQLTLGEIKAMAQKTEAPKKDEGTASEATATVSSPVQEQNNVASSEYEEFFNNYVAEEDNYDASFSLNMAEIEAIRPINPDILETRMHYWSSEDQEAESSDKKCIVCGKRNMNWTRYAYHLEYAHDLYMTEDSIAYLKMDDIESAKESWIRDGPDTPNPRLYDSVNEQDLSEFETDNESEPPTLVKIKARKPSFDVSSDSEDAASDSSIKSTSSRPRQQLGKKLKNMSNRIDTFGENVEKFEEKLLGIENNAKKISENLSTLNVEHKSSTSTLKSSLEKSLGKVEGKFIQMHVSHEESSKELKKLLEKAQELSSNLDKELKNSQRKLEDSNKELKMLQEESSRKIQNLEEKIEISQKESAKENLELKSGISDIMTFLKNEWRNPKVISEPLNQSSDSNINGNTVPTSEVMTSIINSSITTAPISVVKRTLEEAQLEEINHTMSDPTTFSKNNIINLDSLVIQAPVEEKAQFSSAQAVDQVNNSGMESTNSQEVSIKDIPVLESNSEAKIPALESKSEVKTPVLESKSEAKTPALESKPEAKFPSEKAKATKKEQVPQIENLYSESTQRLFVRKSFETIKDFTSIFSSVVSSPLGIVYMMLFMMMFNVGIARAANIQDQGNFLSPNAFSRIQPDQDMIIFDATSIDTMEFLFDLGEVKRGIHTGINSSCNAIKAVNKQCALHPENCQAAELAIMNSESSIEKFLQTEYALQRVCSSGETSSSKEIIRRCHAGEDWDSQFRSKRHIPSRAVPSGTSVPEVDYTSSEEHLDEESFVERVRRFVISGAILLATAFGIAGMALAGGVAAVVSDNQARKVLNKVQGHRAEDVQNSITNDNFILGLIQDTGSDLDGVREITTLATHAQTNLNKAISLENKFSHLISRSGIVEFSDPSQELYMQEIKRMNNRDTEGLTRNEVGQKTRVSADITTMTTFIIPTKPSSALCEQRMVLKTLFVPVINHRSRRVVVTEGGKLFPKFGDKSRYILLSRNSLLSKQTKLFESTVRIVGRSCTLHVSVNATVTPSTNPLFEDFHFRLNGNLTITEICPSNTTKWTISSNTKLRLPLACSLQSTLINCNSIPIKSGDTQVVHFSNHRMQIMEQHWNEEKLDFNETVFARSKITVDSSSDDSTSSFLDSLDDFKTPIIGSGGAAITIAIVIIVIITAIKCQRGSTPPQTPFIVQTTATSSPVVTATSSPVGTASAPPPAYGVCQPTMDPDQIRHIDLLSRTPAQATAMRQHSMRKQSHHNIA